MSSQHSYCLKRDDPDTQHARPASLARICYSCLCASKFNSQHLGINADATAPMQAPLNACSHPTSEHQDETHAYGYNRHRKLRTSCSCKVRVECIHNGGQQICFLDRLTLNILPLNARRLNANMCACAAAATQRITPCHLPPKTLLFTGTCLQLE